MMEKEYIDVDYTEREDTPQPKNGDITICADPTSAAITGFCGIVNNITNSIKEYNICKQHEETRRAEIKAQLKLGFAQINAQKEALLTQMNQEHELKMLFVQNYFNSLNREFDMAFEEMKTTIEIAKENKDMSALIDFMRMRAEISQTHSQFLLECMDKTINQNPSQTISLNPVQGYLK